MPSGAGTYVPVAGTADGEPFRTRLTPRGGGVYRLFLNGANAGGDSLGRRRLYEVANRAAFRDGAPSEVPCPDDLAACDGRYARTCGLEAFSAADGGAAQASMIASSVERAKRAPSASRSTSRAIARQPSEGGWWRY